MQPGRIPTEIDLGLYLLARLQRLVVLIGKPHGFTRLFNNLPIGMGVLSAHTLLTHIRIFSNSVNTAG